MSYTFYKPEGGDSVAEVQVLHHEGDGTTEVRVKDPGETDLEKDEELRAPNERLSDDYRSWGPLEGDQ